MVSHACACAFNVRVLKRAHVVLYHDVRYGRDSEVVVERELGPNRSRRGHKPRRTWYQRWYGVSVDIGGTVYGMMRDANDVVGSLMYTNY